MPDMIGVQGLRNFAKVVKSLDDKTLLDELKDANQRAGEIVADEARRRAPRRSGKLAGSIKSARTQSGVAVSVGRKSIPYARPIHFGWATRPNRAKGWRGGPIRPNPFLYDAVDARQEQVVATFAAQLERVAAKVERLAGG